MGWSPTRSGIACEGSETQDTRNVLWKGFCMFLQQYKCRKDMLCTCSPFVENLGQREHYNALRSGAVYLNMEWSVAVPLVHACHYALYRARETNEFAVALFGRQQYKGECVCKIQVPLLTYFFMNNSSNLTAFCAWDSTPHPPGHPSAQLMRPGIGRNVFCPVGDFV